MREKRKGQPDEPPEATPTDSIAPAVPWPEPVNDRSAPFPAVPGAPMLQVKQFAPKKGALRVATWNVKKIGDDHTNAGSKFHQIVALILRHHLDAPLIQEHGLNDRRWVGFQAALRVNNLLIHGCPVEGAHGGVAIITPITVPALNVDLPPTLLRENMMAIEIGSSLGTAWLCCLYGPQSPYSANSNRIASQVQEWALAKCDLAEATGRRALVGGDLNVPLGEIDANGRKHREIVSDTEPKDSDTGETLVPPSHGNTHEDSDDSSDEYEVVDIRAGWLASGLENLVHRAQGETFCHTHRLSSDRANRATLDYLLGSEHIHENVSGATVLNTWAEAGWGSDHAPVLAEIVTVSTIGDAHEEQAGLKRGGYRKFDNVRLSETDEDGKSGHDKIRQEIDRCPRIEDEIQQAMSKPLLGMDEPTTHLENVLHLAAKAAANVKGVSIVSAKPTARSKPQVSHRMARVIQAILLAREMQSKCTGISDKSERTRYEKAQSVLGKYLTKISSHIDCAISSGQQESEESLTSDPPPSQNTNHEPQNMPQAPHAVPPTQPTHRQSLRKMGITTTSDEDTDYESEVDTNRNDTQGIPPATEDEQDGSKTILRKKTISALQDLNSYLNDAATEAHNNDVLDAQSRDPFASAATIVERLSQIQAELAKWERQQRIQDRLYNRDYNFEHCSGKFFDQMSLNTRAQYAHMSVQTNTENGTKIVREPDEVKKGWGDYYAKAFSVPKKPEHKPKIMSTAFREFYEKLPKRKRANLDDIFAPTTTSDLRAAIPKGKGKAPGPDNISTAILLYLSEPQFDFVVDCMNVMLERAGEGAPIVPSFMKDCELVCIPKSKDRPATDPDNSRPIALCSTINKLFERILKDRIMNALLKKKVLNRLQKGSIPGGTCHEQLAALIDVMTDANRNGKAFFNVLYDYRRAFGSIPFCVVRAGLARIGAPGTLLILYDGMMRGRRGAVFTGHGIDWNTDAFDICQGTLQGSTLAGLLYMIAIDPLMCAVNKKELGYVMENGTEYLDAVL